MTYNERSEGRDSPLSLVISKDNDYEKIRSNISMLHNLFDVELQKLTLKKANRPEMRLILKKRMGKKVEELFKLMNLFSPYVF